MIYRYLASTALALFCLLALAQSNKKVLEIAYSYSGGGYKWSSSGAPKAIIFKDSEILKKSTQGTFCSGYTFTVAFEALDQAGKIDHLSLDQVKWLQRNWYGTNEASAETQCLYALKKLGLGFEVKMREAKAGDFVQFWRNNKSGHSVIFLDWVKNESGEITGIKYRSTQKSTNGIGDRTETIGTGEKEINLSRLYIVRLKG